MGSREKEEFIILLLLENNCFNNIRFADYIENKYDSDRINKRYRELLDDFLNEYALNKTEKSDENISS
jgi:hypothetical protein